MTEATFNGTPLRALLRGCPPSDGAWWRRCACGAPLAFSEVTCTGRDRHPQPPLPVQLYATETGGARNLRAMRDAGFRLLTSPVYLAEHGWHEPPWAYALDNGAWSYHQRGQDFDADAFARAVDRVGEAADFLVLPDVVARGERSLELSMRWHAQLADHPAPRYLVVQDGMGEDLPLAGLAGLFVGGTTEWKRSTMRGWARVAARHGLALHVGRVNSARLIREVLAIGAESGCPVSCDGTSATLYASTAPALGQAATGAPQLLLGLS